MRKDAISVWFARRQAVIGLSLGGYFAACLGTAVKEFAPKALVIYYGMYALAGSELMRCSVPLLLLQGENDDDEFVAAAERVKEIAVPDGKPWSVVFYPGTGHQFDLFEPRGAAARDAWERTVSFLESTWGHPNQETRTCQHQMGHEHLERHQDRFIHHFQII